MQKKLPGAKVCEGRGGHACGHAEGGLTASTPRPLQPGDQDAAPDRSIEDLNNRFEEASAPSTLWVF